MDLAGKTLNKLVIFCEAIASGGAPLVVGGGPPLSPLGDGIHLGAEGPTWSGGVLWEGSLFLNGKHRLERNFSSGIVGPSENLKT